MSKNTRKTIAKTRAKDYLDYISNVYPDSNFCLVTGSKNGEIIRLKVYDSGLVTEM